MTKVRHFSGTMEKSFPHKWLLLIAQVLAHLGTQQILAECG